MAVEKKRYIYIYIYSIVEIQRRKAFGGLDELERRDIISLALSRSLFLSSSLRIFIGYLMLFALLSLVLD